MKRRSLFLLPVLAVAAITVSQVAYAGGSVNVSGKEFKFTLSKKSISHGNITFNFKNAGTLGHDFKIDGKTTAVINAGKTATLKVNLKKGTYTYMCTVPGHAQSGMKGTFKVT